VICLLSLLFTIKCVFPYAIDLMLGMFGADPSTRPSSDHCSSHSRFAKVQPEHLPTVAWMFLFTAVSTELECEIMERTGPNHVMSEKADGKHHRSHWLFTCSPYRFARTTREGSQWLDRRCRNSLLISLTYTQSPHPPYRATASNRREISPSFLPP
jgi:hypothetical protein